MSYTQAEVELLKECLKEICDDHFFSELHELKKKLAASNAKQQDLETKVRRYEEDIERLKACHSCHILMKTFSDACTQTAKQGASSEPAPDITPKPTAKENGYASDNHMQVDDSPPKPAELTERAIPATPAARATPAIPATHVTPVTPATPAKPATLDTPVKPATPAAPTTTATPVALAIPAVPKYEVQPIPSTSKAIPVEQEVICISDSDDDI